MTGTKVDAMELLSKTLQDGQGDFMKQALALMLHQYMDAEANALCGAGRYERSGERVNYRNGTRPRDFETRLGTIPLSIPKLRKGSYLPTFINPRRRWEQAFVCVVCEAYVLGISTRKVEELVEAMGAKGMSRSEVSRMASTLDEQVEAWRNRPLDRSYPYMWLDAVYVKVREGVHVVSKAILVAYAVNDEGYREVLGAQVADGEMEDAWRAFLEDLVDRGLKGLQLIISDAHTGLKAARQKVFNAIPWQRCRVHFMRNVLSRVPKTAQGFVAATIRAVFAQESLEAAQDTMLSAIEMLEKKYPAAARILEEGSEDVLAFMAFPSAHRRQIHSTNPLERLNREIRRRTNVVGIFPNSQSVMRLVGMLLIEQNDEWAIGRRYFSQESLTPLLENSNQDDYLMIETPSQ